MLRFDIESWRDTSEQDSFQRAASVRAHRNLFFEYESRQVCNCVWFPEWTSAGLSKARVSRPSFPQSFSQLAASSGSGITSSGSLSFANDSALK